MKCERNCLSHAAQLLALNGRNAARHFMNQATFLSTFPIFVITRIFGFININDLFIAGKAISS